jgi:hypothetical protein
MSNDMRLVWSCVTLLACVCVCVCVCVEAVAVGQLGGALQGADA